MTDFSNNIVSNSDNTIMNNNVYLCSDIKVNLLVVCNT